MTITPEAPRPACWSWGGPDFQCRTLNDLFAWQAGRCGYCGQAHGELVLDHDHTTRWARGYLCLRCNYLEAQQPDLFAQYHALTPAMICDLAIKYQKGASNARRGASWRAVQADRERRITRELNRFGGYAQEGDRP